MKILETTKTILSEIRSGRWELGARLPPERQITQELSVSRVTVRNALSRLAQQGIIMQRQGSGTYLVRKPDRLTDRKVLLAIQPGLSKPKAQPFRRKRIVTQHLLRFAFLHDMSENDLIGLAILGGVMAFAKRRGHEIMVGPSRANASAGGGSDFSPQVYRPDADGIILAVSLRKEDVQRLKKIRVPVVILNAEGVFASLPNVVSADVIGACHQAIQQLAAGGHRRIAILEKSFGGAHSRFTHECDYLRKELHGPEIRCYFGEDPFLQMPAGANAPTALYVSDDVYCVELCRRLSARGIHAGRGISIISLANRGIERGLPSAVGRMEFDTGGWGRTAAHTLEYMLDEAILNIPPIRLGARYLPGSADK
ncbi:MAG: GntR family transcriptional regulator [Verrucomicrobia bacterium]|nr:GntR family transcriptional regulator [Verrucomicrobiota bacterium]